MRFIAVRVLTIIATLLAVITLIFFVVRLAPGDPAMAALGEDASPAAVAELRHELGLDRSLPVQYLRYLADLIQGEFGESLVSRRPVLEQIVAVFPYTLELTFAAVLLGVVLGVPAGAACALWRNSWIDYLGRIVSLAGLSVPAFFSAILLILVFALGTGWFPVITELDLSHPLDRLRNLALPALSLGMLMTAYVSRATRSAMLEVLNEEYIVTARAKGVPQRAIVFRHALRNALIPIVTVVGLYLGLLIGNSVLTELVFNRPGIGRLIVTAIEQRDYTLLQGVMVVFAMCIAAANLLTDVAYTVVDPRVRR